MTKKDLIKVIKEAKLQANVACRHHIEEFSWADHLEVKLMLKQKDMPKAIYLINLIRKLVWENNCHLELDCDNIDHYIIDNKICFGVNPNTPEWLESLKAAQEEENVYPINQYIFGTNEILEEMGIPQF